MSESQHDVLFYEEDEFFPRALADSIAGTLQAGDACLVFSNADARGDIEEQLRQRGFEVEAAGESCIWAGAEATLADCMSESELDAECFAATMSSLIERAAAGRRRVWIFNGLAAALCQQNQPGAAIRLEALWEQLRSAHNFSLVCFYPPSVFGEAALRDVLDEIFNRHDQVIPFEGSASMQDSQDRSQDIASLRRQSQALQNEMRQRDQNSDEVHQLNLRYDRLFGALRDGFFLVDPRTRRITDANPVMSELFDRPREALLGKELWEIGLLRDREAADEAFRVLRDTRILLNQHAEIERPDGQRRDLEFTCKYFQDENNEVVQCTIHDVTDLRNAEEVRSHLAAIVESSDDAIISKSMEGIILTWNQGAAHLFGYTPEEVIGQSILILIPPDLYSEETVILERLRRGERIDHYETVRVTRDGRLLDISLTVSPVRNSRGEIIAASKIARDISGKKQAEAEREELLRRERAARTEAEAANRAKDEFLAVLSHELRTPLNAILGWARMLRTGKFDPETIGRALETIERNAKSQAQLIEDLLDISRIITGKLRIDVRPVELTSIIAAAIDVVRPAADAKSIQLRVSLDPTVGTVSGDPARLQQIIWNLLSNAVKFTPSGGSVQIYLERADQQVQVRVSDTGRGINPEFLPFVFERFRQADSTLTRAHGGLGLGLAIVRHLVELHGGTIHAESPGEGHGATFTVRLPISRTQAIKQSGESHEEMPAEAAMSPALLDLRVLVVDDDPDAREMLRVLLEQHGANVLTAASAPEALELFERMRPALLVSDIEMPGEDGYSLIRKLRAQEGNLHDGIPALALTAHAKAEDARQALQAGYHAHLAKPVEPVALIAVLERLAENR